MSANRESIERPQHDCIVVTGFGLFRDHNVNPSWEAIKDNKLKINRPNIHVIAKQVAVSYQDVDQVVETIWKEHKPILVVHIGLAAHEDSIRLEQMARHGPYIHDDVVKYAPHKHLRDYNIPEGSLEENIKRHEYACKPCNFASTKTCLNIERVCDKLNQLVKQKQLVIPFKGSQDAGLYLCEYIYQKSLSICDRSVFIHVPDVEKFKLEDITKSIGCCIEVVIDELNEV